jgi:hypothetical protein
LAVVRAIESPSVGTVALAAETARHDSKAKTVRFTFGTPLPKEAYGKRNVNSWEGGAC